MKKAFLLAVALAIAFVQKPTSGMREWAFYGGDPAGTKYSPLIHINRNNVQKLEIAWQWKTGEKRAKTGGSFSIRTSE